MGIDKVFLESKIVSLQEKIKSHRVHELVIGEQIKQVGEEE
jgi:hypothetical protein